MFANALVEGNNPESATCTVLAEGEYDLRASTLCPRSGDLFTGEEIRVGAGANPREHELRRRRSVRRGVSWSVARARKVRSPVRGCRFHSLANPIVLLPRRRASIVKVTATSGSSSSRRSPQARRGTASLEGAAKRLDAGRFRANPVYGPDDEYERRGGGQACRTRVRRRVRSPRVRRAASNDEQVTVGVSTAAATTNGAVTYFFVDPDSAYRLALCLHDRRASSISRSRLRAEGETYEYAPRYAGTIPWDDARVAELPPRRPQGWRSVRRGRLARRFGHAGPHAALRSCRTARGQRQVLVVAFLDFVRSGGRAVTGGSWATALHGRRGPARRATEPRR